MSGSSELLALLIEAVHRIDAIATDAPELNMSNFDEDDVSALNAAMIEIFHIARNAADATLSDLKPRKAPSNVS